jgi:hypothetical protein
MMSEWLRVMLEEIERKRQDSEQAELEQSRRDQEAAGGQPPPMERPKG